MMGSIASLPKRLPSLLRRKITHGRYRPEIDGLRFIAIFFVLIGHLAERVTRFSPATDPSTKDFFEFIIDSGLGVHTFFAISGFVITSQYMSANRSALNGSFLKNYYLRRVLRIEPPYFAILLGTYFLITGLHYAPPGVHRFFGQPASLTESLFASIFYFHSWIFGNVPRLFGPGWTLEIEVQFYVLAPLLLWLFLEKLSSRSRPAIGALALCVGVFCVAIPKTSGPVYSEYTLLGHFHAFFLGLMLASFQNPLRAAVQTIDRRLVDAIAWLALLGMLFTKYIPDNVAMNLARDTCIALLFMGSFAPGTTFFKFLSGEYVSLLGGACYSLYLTHEQIQQVLTSVLVKTLHIGSPVVNLAADFVFEMPIVIVVGMAFYTFVERPFMTPRWPWKVASFLKIRTATAFSRRPASPPRSEEIGTRAPEKERRAS